MPDMPQGRNRELVLPPNTYAYVLDSTKGKVSAYVGPYKNSLSETDQVVVWDHNTQQFLPVESTEKARQVWALAGEGEYIILTNPAPAGQSDHPPRGQATEAADLQFGRRVIVPGPATFPLWPGQMAQTLDGHHLRHNQYVIVRVYDEEQARANWDSAVVAPQIPVPTLDDPDATVPGVTPVLTEEARSLKMGQLIIMPGTQVSFYMPSTGVEVVPEGGTMSNNVTFGGTYVRDAVTLETLEYCILLDENGTKRYVRGPAVVFPHPTETFKTNENRSRVFDAIELNEQSGLYVKVIEEYEDNGVTHPVGEELFITGKEQAIYFPRAEHSVITYGGKRKHHAIAVPAGEGRYVLDRREGEVRLDRGPAMLLPDPRFEVIVRRILDQHDVQVMFPGNAEALAVNLGYAAERARDAQDYLENAEARKSLRPDKGGRSAFAGNEQPIAVAASAGQAFMDDTISRQTTYTPPRTITLDTKYEGAVAVSPFPGYAIMVTDKVGNRRVEVGPQVILLGYDETIAALNLSTGRPKTDDVTLKTGYLRIVNNVVSDIVEVETRDLVPLLIELSYRVNFEGDTPDDRLKWFEVENYVQVLTDHCRSRLRNLAKRHDIRNFYENNIDIIRDGLLGPANETDGRPGLFFQENGMRVYDVEILSVTIESEDVAELLNQAQTKALTGAIELGIAEESFTRQQRLEEIRRDALREKERTTITEAEIDRASAERLVQASLDDNAADLELATTRRLVEDTTLDLERARFEQGVALRTQSDQAEVARLAEETTQFIRRMEALGDPLITAMQSLSDHALMEKVVTAIGPMAIAAGLTTADILERMFAGTPMASIAEAFAARPLATPFVDQRSIRTPS